ncbi:hypothetical protein AAB990_40085 [Burkholderia contaminans]|uniref:hypothetical protein n=1 Tax=Burkholderia contaminans TaxID=488447 RepID=UPI002415EB7F|nr:hypothetical protein [Burkholderia contaminans]WFN15760.1 hypothetical protein LXE92_40655 [Burkholderia contaminans]
MPASSTMIERFWESMKSTRVSGATRLMALGLPTLTFILMFGFSSSLRHPIPNNGTAAFLTLSAAYLVATMLVVPTSNENCSLTEGDRLILMAGATISVTLGLFVASYFWFM